MLSSAPNISLLWSERSFEILLLQRFRPSGTEDWRQYSLFRELRDKTLANVAVKSRGQLQARTRSRQPELYENSPCLIWLRVWLDSTLVALST